MVTRRNIAAEVISFIFIVLCDDIIDPRNGTSEPVEHIFGLLLGLIPEFTVQELAQLVEKLTRHLRLIFGNRIVPLRDPKKSYGST